MKRSGILEGEPRPLISGGDIAAIRREIIASSPIALGTVPVYQAGIGVIEKYGAIRGTGYAVWRILRCQPFCKGGHDPVP